MFIRFRIGRGCIAALRTSLGPGRDVSGTPVRMIIPYAPVGASDFIGRILQPKLAEELGQQLVVDNRPGASGNIGVETAARATPDGYTFLLGNVSSIGINPSMFPNFPVRPAHFIPVGAWQHDVNADALRP